MRSRNKPQKVSHLEFLQVLYISSAKNQKRNKSFKDHLDWHTFAAQARLYHVPRASMSRIVDKLTEEELSELAITIAKKDFADIGLLLRGEFTLPSFLNILENWSRVSSFPYKHEVTHDVHNFIIQHDMGRKYSFLIKELYRYTLEEIFERKSCSGLCITPLSLFKKVNWIVGIRPTEPSSG
jgi:hypothetical protein